VLTLETGPGVYTHIAIHKIIAIRAQPKKAAANEDNHSLKAAKAKKK
jgi:hypothetical protein